MPSIRTDQGDRLADELEHFAERAISFVVNEGAPLGVFKRDRVGLVRRHQLAGARRQEALVTAGQGDAERACELEERARIFEVAAGRGIARVVDHVVRILLGFDQREQR